MATTAQRTVQAVGVLLATALTVAAHAETLREVLEARGLPASTLRVVDVDQPITSYEAYDDSAAFLIAYYQDEGSGALGEPLFVSRYDKTSDEWKTVAIRERDARPDEDADCLGSVTGIHASAYGYYLDTHINPSAGCLLVLSPELQLEKSLYGWFLAAFGDGRVVYHHSQVHFAAVHAAEVYLYDPALDREVKVYPLEPYQVVRTEQINRLRALYQDENWCRANNHPCDPEQFDNHLASEVEINDTTDALAFQVTFDNSRLPVAGAADINVVYLYRNVSRGGAIEYRELLPQELQRKVGSISLHDCLQPESLERIFAP